MRLGALRGPSAGICVIVAASLAAATPAQAGQARSAGSAARKVGPLLLAWGDNFYGQLGDGTVMDRHAPVAVNPPAGLKATSARVGSFAAAVTPSGQLMAWGLGTSGQLGNGERKSSNLPVRVDLPRGVQVKAVSAGANSAIALTSTGRVLAWGDNHEGQLGNGRTRNSGRPVWVKIPRATRIIAVGAGVGQMFAVTGSGGLLAWGDNEGGQLGDGTMENHKLPAFVHIPRSVRIATLAAGRYFSLALTSTGKVWAWGDDSSGELGDGLNIARATPFQVSVPGTVLAIGSGCEGSSSMAVVTNVKD